MNTEQKRDHPAEEYQPDSVDDVRDRIESFYKLKLPDNDPLLLEVDVHRALFFDKEKQFKRHLNTLSKTVDESAASLAETVAESLKVFKDDTLKASLENTLSAVSEKAKDSERLLQKVRSFGRVCTVLTALNWIAVITLFFIFK